MVVRSNSSCIRLPTLPRVGGSNLGLPSFFNSEEQVNSSMGHRVYDGSVINSTRRWKRKAGAANHGETGKRTWKEDVQPA